MRNHDYYEDDGCKECNKKPRYPKHRISHFVTNLLAILGGAILTAILALLLCFNNTTTPVLTGIETTLDNGQNMILSNDSPVLFNTITNNQSDDIVYNTSTGEFTIRQTGNYYISWWIDIDGSSAFSTASFSIAVNGVPQSTASTPVITGQLSATTLITVESTPTIITLINTSEDDIVIANTTIQANIVISNTTSQP